MVKPPLARLVEAERALIEPVGDSHWMDRSFDGKRRHTQVNLTLGTLLRLHYPGLVKVGEGPEEQEVLVSNWEEYKLKKEVEFGDRQGLVRRDFWVNILVNELERPAKNIRVILNIQVH